MPSLEDLTVDQLLAHAKSLEPQANLLSALMKDPATREATQRLVKQKFPQTSIPEIDAKDSVLGKVNELREDNEKLRREIQEDQIRRRLTDQRKDIINRHSLTEADMIEVEKLMTREADPIPTYEGAALVYKASKISATPTPAAFIPPTFSLTEGKDDPWAKAMTANAPGGLSSKARLDKAGMDAAFAAMGEIMGGKVPGLGSARAN